MFVENLDSLFNQQPIHLQSRILQWYCHSTRSGSLLIFSGALSPHASSRRALDRQTLDNLTTINSQNIHNPQSSILSPRTRHNFSQVSDFTAASIFTTTDNYKMARTRRSRQAVDAPAPAASETEQAAPSRGRTRTSRAAPSKRQESVDNASAAAAAGPSRAAPAASVRNTSVDSVEVGRRALETPSLRRDTTGLDLADDSLFGDLGDSFADGDVPDFEREPRSASTTRSWSTFKPRSRASSVVGRNDPPIRPSSRGGANNSALTTSFNIGAFRRRAREPSILGTTRKGPRSETSGRGAQSDLDSDGELAPDAESTPLHTRRRTRASLASNATVAQRRDVSAANVSTGPATRKRKSEAAAADEERAAKTTRTEETETDSDSEISDLDSPQMPPSTPIRQRAMTPINLDEINAPPASSGSEDEDDVWPDIHALAKRRRRPSVTTPARAAAGDDDEILSDISSPPSLTHSPNHETATRGRASLRAAHHHHQPKPLTTADLANLLPKRRHKKTRADAGSDEEGDEEEEEDADQQEEETVPVTCTRGGRISRPPSRAASATGHKQQQAAASTPTRGRTTRSASKHKTYGRRSSDKENHSDEDEEDDSQFQPLADDTFGDTTAAAAPPDFQSIDELKRATKKFSEVDKWQLEYEEVAESFSPKDAR